MANWVKPLRLDYLPLNERLAVVRLSAELTCETWPRYPGLLVGAPHRSYRSLALGSVTHRLPRRRAADELLWRVSFAVPLELVQCQQALFGLVAAGYRANRLPDPWLATLSALSEPWPASDRLNGFAQAAMARRAAALGTAVAVATSGFASPVAALAAGKAPVHAARAIILAPRQPSASSVAGRPAASTGAVGSNSGYGSSPDSRAAGRSSHPAHAVKHPHRVKAASPGSRAGSSAGGVVLSHPHPTGATLPTSRSSAESAPGHKRGAGSHHHRLTRHTPNSQASGLSSLSTTPPAGLATGGAPDHHRLTRHTPNSQASGLSSLSTTPPAGLATGGAPDHHGQHAHGRSDHGHIPSTGQHAHHRHGRAGGAYGKHGGHPGKNRHPGAGHGEHRHPSGGGRPAPRPKPAPPRPAPEPQTPTSAPSVGLPSGNSSPWTAGMGLTPAEAALLSHLSGLKPPKFLIPIYKKAGAKYHIPWPVLAAINSIETDYGRDLKVSPAGAEGWMQFMPSTWARYGVAVDHSGPANPYNPADAIFSAARYLAASGGAKHIRRAVLAYNHAQWYVNQVMWRAAVINSLAGGRAAPGFANPFRGGWIPNRLDMGYDGTFAHLLAAPFSGTITFAARSFSNWGGYVQLRADHPIKGLPTRTFYFAEGLSPLFRAGTHVHAGTPIAVAAPSPWGDAYNTTGRGQGQIEWGLAESGPTGAPTDPLAETGIQNPARMVKAFAIWAVEHLGVAPPASTDHAGFS